MTDMAVSSPAGAQAGEADASVPPRRGDMLAGRQGWVLLLLWLGWSLVLIRHYWPEISQFRLLDADDYLRLVQVRDWMAGQPWLDIGQHRINPPTGGEMHWSRYVDVPIALLIGLFGLVLPPWLAETVALVLMPLIFFGLTMFCLFKASERLSDTRTALLTVALLPGAFLLTRQMSPLRIDHHAVQIWMAALALWMVMRGDHWRNAMVAGLALAFWMHVSMEGMPMAVLFGAVYAWFYLRGGDRQLPAYLAALTLGSAFLLATTRAPAMWGHLYCDAISWPLLAAMALPAAGVGALALIRPAAALPLKLVVLGGAGALGAAVYFMGGGACALDPFSNLDPLVRHFWYDNVLEGLGIAKQQTSIAVVLVILPLMGMAGAIARAFSLPKGELRVRWIILTLLIAALGLLSWKVMRVGAVAGLFAMPALGWLALVAVRWGQSLPSAALRVPATALGVLAVTPLSALALGVLLEPASEARFREKALKKVEKCEFSALGRLPAGLVFAGLDIGPRLLVETPHSVIATGHHRNHLAMKKVILAFTSPVDKAAPIIRQSGADYLAMCRDWAEPHIYAAEAPRGLSADLLKGRVPAWLEPVRTKGNYLLLYRIKKDPAVKPAA